MIEDNEDNEGNEGQPARRPVGRPRKDRTQPPTPEEFAQAETSYADINDVETALEACATKGAKIVIFRKRLGQANPEYVDTWQAADFTPATLKDAHGGGQYFLRAHLTDGTLYKQFTLAIDPNAKPASASNPQNANGEMTSLLRQFIEASSSKKNATETLLEAAEKRAEREARERREADLAREEREARRFERNVALLTAAAPIVIAYLNRPASPIPSAPPPDPMQQEMMKAIMERAFTSKEDNLASALDMIKKVKEISGDAPQAEKEDKGNSILETIITAGGQILPALIGGMNQQTTHNVPLLLPAPQQMQQAQPRNVTPQAEAQPQQPPQPQAPNIPPPQQSPIITAFLSQMLTASENDSDPVSYGNIILDSLDIEQLKGIAELLKKDDFLNILYPNIEIKNPAFFEALRKQLLEDILVITESQLQTNFPNVQPVQPVSTAIVSSPPVQQ